MEAYRSNEPYYRKQLTVLTVLHSIVLTVLQETAIVLNVLQETVNCLILSLASTDDCSFI